MAEYTVVPRNQVHKLPGSVPLEMGALVEPMSVAYHAAVLGGVGDQGSALIFGAGPIGIGIWFALRGMGLTEIDMVEPSPVRRASIEALGARTLDPASEDVPALIAERTGGQGVDAAFDAAGVEQAVHSALQCVGERRPLISVAIYDKPLLTPLINLVLRERRIQGTICYTGDDYRAVIDLMARQHYDTTGWVDTVPISGVIEQGFEPLRAAQDEAPCRPGDLTRRDPPGPAWSARSVDDHDVAPRVPDDRAGLVQPRLWIPHDGPASLGDRSDGGPHIGDLDRRGGLAAGDVLGWPGQGQGHPARVESRVTVPVGELRPETERPLVETGDIAHWVQHLAYLRRGRPYVAHMSSFAGIKVCLSSVVGAVSAACPFLGR